MQFSKARFVSVVGTEVVVTPTTNADARIAIKELRQKKREYGLKKRVLAHRQKIARDAAERASGSKEQRKKTGFLAGIGRLFGKVKARKPRQTLAEVEAELTAVDEILYNIDSCTVQIQGRLLHLD
ncbi:MAG: hypothetical protein ACRCS9_05590 [Hyphomicrobium sp.]